jgi:hypothetical protein
MRLDFIAKTMAAFNHRWRAVFSESGTIKTAAIKPIISKGFCEQ